MKVRISKLTKKVLQNIDVEKYSTLVNEMYSLPDPELTLTVEKEWEATTAVKELLRRYFPKVLEDYNVFLTLEDFKFGEDPKYFLTLRKKSNNFS